MSIWTDCEKYDALPFYGFPVIPKVKEGVFTFEFPEGYIPNGSQTLRVAEKLKELFGKEILGVTDKIIRILIDEDKLAVVLYQYYLKG